MRIKHPAALLLVLTCLLFSGCGASSGEGSAGSSAAGEDWRTWGWIDDWAILEADDGEEIPLLLCVFTQNAVLYLDSEEMTEFADLSYPYPVEDAQEAFESFSLFDQNGDGSSDVRLLFIHDDGTQTEFIWCWDGEQFVYDPALGWTGPAQYERSEGGWEYVP